jgi:hypothetical protein
MPCCLDELLNNLAGLINIACGDEQLDAVRDGIWPPPADIFILKQALDAAPFQDGFEQIDLDDVAGVMTLRLSCFIEVPPS